MKVRAPKINQIGTIDCEVEDAVLGWIPITCSRISTDPIAAEAYSIILSGAAGELGKYYPLAGVEKTFAELKQEKIDEVDLIAKDKRDSIIKNYSAGEMASWPIKREEALAWLGNPNIEIVTQLAPFLNAEATYRQVTVTQLADKVILKANQLSAVEAALAGYTGYLQDLIKVVAENDMSALTSIDIKNNWPM